MGDLDWYKAASEALANPHNAKGSIVTAPFRMLGNFDGLMSLAIDRHGRLWQEEPAAKGYRLTCVGTIGDVR